jgi:L-iditol 2-dehydrogenase
MAPSIVLDPPSSVAIQTKSVTQTNGDAVATQQKQQILKAPLPNPSLMVTADHKLKNEEAPVYAPGHGDVLLHIKATGVCGYVESMNLRYKALTDCIEDQIFTSGKQVG